jgi:uncharacterized protein YdbL (DUF1318 family)
VTVNSSGGWLLVSVSTAGAGAALRVQVWRKLRSLGALYLQQSVCLLPARDEVVREVRRLADRVRRQGGSCRLLHVSIADDSERAQLVADMNAARDQEYGEVLERLPELVAELGNERARGRTTYAEVEENEADLERYQSWLAKIAARDYFGAPRGEEARAAVAGAAAELAAFEQAALSAEAPPEHAPPTSGRIRGSREATAIAAAIAAPVTERHKD